MFWILAISVVVSAAMVAAWYCIFSRYNRRRSLEILSWLEAALGQHGEIVGVRWAGSSRFLVPLRLDAGVFERANIVVEMVPRELPFHWLMSRWRKQQDTVTFSADLDVPPAMNLELHNHRWCGRTKRRLPMNIERWGVEQSVPLVLTSRADWDMGGMVSSLLATPRRDFLELRIRRQSPHLRARVPLESIAPDSPASGQVFAMLRELAVGVSTSSM
jgi:hypothetical protein